MSQHAACNLARSCHGGALPAQKNMWVHLVHKATKEKDSGFGGGRK